MDVILLRHGKTAGNLAGRFVGRTDEPLCDEGRREAAAGRPFQDADRVFVSPLCRARETAALLFPGAEQTVIDGLREMDFGDFEGRIEAELAADPVYLAWREGGIDAACPNGESIRGFAARAGAAFDEAVRMAVAAGEERMALVAHGGTLMAIMTAFAETKRPYLSWFVENCHGYRAQLDPETWTERPVLTHCAPLAPAPR